MFQSFIVYGFLGFFLGALGIVASKREVITIREGKKTPFLTWEILFSLLLFAFVSGIRWNVGGDHLSYLENYQDLISGFSLKRDNIEGGFIYISKIFASLNIHFTIYFGFWAFLQLFFVYYAYRNERYLLPYLGLLILFGGQYLSWMNGIRQTLAACIFVFSINFIFERKILKYFIAIFFASLCHKSAIFLSIFYFIPNLDYFKNRTVTIGLFCASLLIGANPSWLATTEKVSQLLTIIGYENYANRLDYYIFEEQKIMAFGPRRILILVIYIIIIWKSKEVKAFFKNSSFLLTYNLTIIGSIYFNIFANTSHIFLRPSYFFTIFTPITLSYLLYYLKASRKTISLQFLIVFILSVSYLPMSIIADYGKDLLDFTNFKFFWNFN